MTLIAGFPRLNEDDTEATVVMKLCDRNANVARLLNDLIARDLYGRPCEPAFRAGATYLSTIDDYGLYGIALWVMFTDLCKRDMVMLTALLNSLPAYIIGKLDLLEAIAMKNGNNEIDVLNMYVQAKKRWPMYALPEKAEWRKAFQVTQNA